MNHRAVSDSVPSCLQQILPKFSSESNNPGGLHLHSPNATTTSKTRSLASFCLVYPFSRRNVTLQLSACLCTGPPNRNVGHSLSPLYTSLVQARRRGTLTLPPPLLFSSSSRPPPAPAPKSTPKHSLPPLLLSLSRQAPPSPPKPVITKRAPYSLARRVPTLHIQGKA